MNNRAKVKRHINEYLGFRNLLYVTSNIFFYMIKPLFIILAFQLITNNSQAQAKDYKLVSKDINADFNYRAIDFIDTTGKRRNIFYPVKGQFTVFTFIATYKGWSLHEEKQIEMHDIVIVKTNKQNKIIDAYQYTLEWAEMPLSYDLYKATTKGLTLTNHFPLAKLQLKRVNYFTKDGREFKDQGTLTL